MKTLDEGRVQTRIPAAKIPTKIEASVVNPSVLEITNSVEYMIGERAQLFRRPKPSTEEIKEMFSELISDRLKFYFEKNVAGHPQIGSPADWNVERVKIDATHSKYAIACILINTKQQDDKWFVFFDATKNFTKGIAPRFFNIKTKRFKLDDFPMHKIITNSWVASEVAVEITKVTFDELMYKDDELEDVGILGSDKF
jgi:hypothetical protein